jgi:hypothetical protein
MRIRAFALSVAITVCLGGVVAACSSDSGDDEGSGGGGSGGSSTGGNAGTSDAGNDSGDQCGQFCSNPTCCDCSASQCTTEYDTCRCEPDCVELIECIRDCTPTDQACQNACFDSHPTGKQIYTALEACASFFCTSECQPGSGDAG